MLKTLYYQCDCYRNYRFIAAGRHIKKLMMGNNAHLFLLGEVDRMVIPVNCASFYELVLYVATNRSVLPPLVILFRSV